MAKLGLILIMTPHEGTKRLPSLVTIKEAFENIYHDAFNAIKEEGSHEGQIYYHRFSAQNAMIQVVDIEPADSYRKAIEIVRALATTVYRDMQRFDNLFGTLTYVNYVEEVE